MQPASLDFYVNRSLATLFILFVVKYHFGSVIRLTPQDLVTSKVIIYMDKLEPMLKSRNISLGVLFLTIICLQYAGVVANMVQLAYTTFKQMEYKLYGGKMERYNLDLGALPVVTASELVKGKEMLGLTQAIYSNRTCHKLHVTKTSSIEVG